MTDRSYEAVSLQETWKAFGRRVAVAAGSSIALLSLLHHVPLSIASLRGGAAFVAVLLVSRVGRFAFERATLLDRRDRPQE